MKEHRVRTLRVTTPGNIASREREEEEEAVHADDPLWGVQLLRLQLQLGPACPDFAHLLGLGDVKEGVAAPHQQLAVSAASKGCARRPVCSICGPSPGPSQPGLSQRRRSPVSQRREAADAEPEATTWAAGAAARDSEETTVPVPCSCSGACAQPLLHLFSGDLDRCWDDVLLALRLLVEPGGSRPRLDADLSVNGVTVCADGRVRACGREAAPVAAPARPCWLGGRDGRGHTPLLLAGRRLLAAGRWAHAHQVAALLLAAGSEPDAVNDEGRSLLSYSVAALDEAAETTRLLLNYGASVWGGPGGLQEAGGELPPLPPLPPLDGPGRSLGAGPSSRSPVFTWFLRAVIRRRRLDEGCLRTLALVSQEMAARPHHMHGLVMRTMFRHSRCYRVLGPVFLQIKTAMARHWGRPQELRALCRRAVRRAVPPGRLHDGVAALGLPASLQDYILLSS